MGSFGPVSPDPFPNAPEITKANNANPITRIKKKDRCLILPSMAMLLVFLY